MNTLQFSKSSNPTLMLEQHMIWISRYLKHNVSSYHVCMTFHLYLWHWFYFQVILI